MKSVEVYKTKKDFKILTLYKLESGSYIASEPIFIVSVEAELEDLGEKLFEALNASRTIKESEEDKFWLGNALLKKIKEASFSKLYATSSSCHVSFDNGIISIAPQKYLGKDKGLEIEEGRASRIALDNNNNNNRLEVIEKITQMLTEQN